MTTVGLEQTAAADLLASARQSRDGSRLDRVTQRFDRVASREQARKVAVEFESLFLAQVLQQLFAGIDPDPLFGGGQAESVYRSFMNEEYGRLLAERGGVGIADQLYDEIVRRNGLSPEETAPAALDPADAAPSAVLRATDAYLATTRLSGD